MKTHSKTFDKTFTDRISEADDFTNPLYREALMETRLS
jgi:hypothetical protein